MTGTQNMSCLLLKKNRLHYSSKTKFSHYEADASVTLYIAVIWFLNGCQSFLVDRRGCRLLFKTRIFSSRLLRLFSDMGSISRWMVGGYIWLIYIADLYYFTLGLKHIKHVSMVSYCIQSSNWDIRALKWEWN